MSNDTIEVDEEALEEYISMVDGLLDVLHDNGYEAEVERVDELKEELIE